MAKVAVIIVAAGKSERFGGNEKKIFSKVDGQPLFLRTVGQFINREDVSQTILVISLGADTVIILSAVDGVVAAIGVVCLCLS